MTAWAARYSATDEPELTLTRDGIPFAYIDLTSPGLAADIAARVDLRECDRPGCTLHAIGQGLCVLHGGRDEL